MKILFISGELIGSALCQRFLREDNEIKLYIHDPARKKCLDGIIPKTEHWEDELPWVGKDGLIVFDDVGFGKIQDRLRSEGYTVFGGTAESDRLEHNRSYAQSILHTYGIKILPSFNFKNVDTAIDFLEENKGKWVVKQSSHISVLNHVGENADASDVIEVLKNYKDKGVKNIHLQKKVTGVEVGIARYFNGEDWVGPIEINHEHKRLDEGDNGPLTAEMGTVMWHSEDESLPLYAKILKPITPHLRKIGFKGDIDINCIANESGIWPLEFTPRLGSPSTQLHCELYESPMAEFFMAVAQGKSYDLKYKKQFGIVMSIATGPFPFPPSETGIDWKEIEHVFEINHDLLEDNDHISLHIEEISKREDPAKEELYWAGEFGYVAYITASGDTIPEAKIKIDRIHRAITLNDMKYRGDIGERVHSHDLQKLKDLGII